MNEKAYKTMMYSGMGNIAVGVLMIVVSITVGVITIISGAHLLRDKKGLTF